MTSGFSKRADGDFDYVTCIDKVYGLGYNSSFNCMIVAIPKTKSSIRVNNQPNSNTIVDPIEIPAKVLSRTLRYGYTFTWTLISSEIKVKQKRKRGWFDWSDIWYISLITYRFSLTLNAVSTCPSLL